MRTSLDSRRTFGVPTFFASIMSVLVSCGSRDASVAGTWTLDTAAFVEAALPVLKEHGRIPAGAEGEAKAQLGKVRMSVDLASDGSFVCHMGIGTTARFEGTWVQNGKNVALVQTLEDGEPKDDQMSGTQDGNSLRLVHDEAGMAMCYVLRRSSAASPR